MDFRWRTLCFARAKFAQALATVPALLLTSVMLAPSAFAARTRNV